MTAVTDRLGAFGLRSACYYLQLGFVEWVGEVELTEGGTGAELKITFYYMIGTGQ
jgi:hypothetical protein